MSTTTEHDRPSWHPDPDVRTEHAVRHALVRGEEDAARAATWWTTFATGLIELRDQIDDLGPLPSTPQSAADWSTTRRIPTNVDATEVLQYLGALIASGDAMAADFRREAARLADESRKATNT
jgi:hypothetical protein